MRILIAAALLCGTATLGLAQPETDNVGHTRHHHPHNPKHETTDDATRFFTDRESPVQIPLPTEKDAFSFVIFGDRTGGPDDGVAILADAVRDVNLLEPDLVMTVGDLIQGYGESVPWMRQMREYRAIMDKLISPWFPVAGNHDVYWRDRGNEEKPPNEHEDRYEMHFGPLWYSFEHKNNHFIVLYTDEGNPETGERTFHKPESQRMSPEQKAFLQEALDRGKDAEHIFVFVHHPRWLKGNYGDDWDTVHRMLAQAGNVAAVFAGHIHYMRHDGKRDGIEYVSLATTGGHQVASVPQAGYLQHYHVVTVRKEQIAMASIPVGEIMDVRDITGDLASQSQQLAETMPPLGPDLAISSDGSVDTTVTATIENPTDYPLDFTITARSWDSRWRFPVDHHHGRLDPGASRRVSFAVARDPGELDSTFRVPEIILERDLLTSSFRYSIPATTVAMPIDPSVLPLPKQPARETALRTGGESSGIARVSSESIDLPDGPFTLECWFNAEDFGGRTGLLCKTEGSDYGIFISDGRPSFSVRLDGRYATVRSRQPVLSTGRWHHIAGVYDGNEVRLYLDGELLGAETASGQRNTNELPLMIGADVNGRGQPTSVFEGLVDEVRLSTGALYAGDSFEPQRRLNADERTVLLYHMDGSIGPWIFDDSSNETHAWLLGDAHLVAQ